MEKSTKKQIAAGIGLILGCGVLAVTVAGAIQAGGVHAVAAGVLSLIAVVAAVWCVPKLIKSGDL